MSGGGEGCVWVGSGRSLPCWVEYCFSYSKTKKVSPSFAASVSKFRNIFCHSKKKNGSFHPEFWSKTRRWRHQRSSSWSSKWTRRRWWWSNLKHNFLLSEFSPDSEKKKKIFGRLGKNFENGKCQVRPKRLKFRAKVSFLKFSLIFSRVMKTIRKFFFSIRAWSEKNGQK